MESSGSYLVRHFVDSSGKPVNECHRDVRVWDPDGWGTGEGMRVAIKEATDYRSILGELEPLFCFELMYAPSARNGFYTLPGIITPTTEIAKVVANRIHDIIQTSYYEQNGPEPYKIDPDFMPLLLSAGGLRVRESFGTNKELVRYCMRGSKDRIQEVLRKLISEEFIEMRRAAIAPQLRNSLAAKEPITVCGSTPKPDKLPDRSVQK